MKPTAGLDAAEALRRLRAFGPNEIEAREARGWTSIARGIATEPMFALLLAAAAVYLAIGNAGEGLLLACFAALTVGLVVIQERRSERALDALRSLARPQVRVRRDGTVRTIAAVELVPGDILLIAEGERIAADGIVREASGLSADESLLTGESVPVRKRADESDMDAEADPALRGADDTPFVFAGSLVASGRAEIEVTRTGSRTRAGEIGLSLAGIARPATPLQQRMRGLVAWLGVGAIAASVVVAVAYGMLRGDWLQGVLSGIAAAMSMLPEEFPMVLTVFFALGAWRLAQIEVLARRPAVIEALGAATVLCVDKTGTLTENRMTLRRLVTPTLDMRVEPGASLAAGVGELLEHARLASRAESADPMDRAIVEASRNMASGMDRSHATWLREREYPLTPGLPVTAHAWRSGPRHVRIAAKGSPEAIAGLCRMDAPDAAAVASQVEALAMQGLRVLGVARVDTATLPEGDLRSCGFQWLGLAAFEDPLRASVPEAVAQAHGAGIAVAMITGDHVLTALAVARQAGIDCGPGALTGPKLDAMDDRELAQAVTQVRVFARVRPEQKLRLVQAFRANGGVVAMTGDGVNDAPALKAAHIGIAMGRRGTDVAREAAGIVLQDDDFGRIVAAARMGRRIQDNLRSVTRYIAAIHVPIAGLALLPLAAGMPPLMLPAHVVLTEMVVDPACSLAFEGAPERPDIMLRPPRPADEPLIGMRVLASGVFQGVFVLAAALGTYALVLRAAPLEEARASALVSLTAGNLGLVWTNATAGRGWRAVAGPGYAAFRWVVAAAVGLLAVGLAVPVLRELLQVGLPPAGIIALSAFAGIASAVAGAWAASRLPH